MQLLIENLINYLLCRPAEYPYHRNGVDEQAKILFQGFRPRPLPKCRVQRRSCTIWSDQCRCRQYHTHIYEIQAKLLLLVKCSVSI